MCKVTLSVVQFGRMNINQLERVQLVVSCLQFWKKFDSLVSLAFTLLLDQLIENKVVPATITNTRSRPRVTIATIILF